MTTISVTINVQIRNNGNTSIESFKGYNSFNESAEPLVRYSIKDFALVSQTNPDRELTYNGRYISISETTSSESIPISNKNTLVYSNEENSGSYVDPEVLLFFDSANPASLNKIYKYYYRSGIFYNNYEISKEFGIDPYPQDTSGLPRMLPTEIINNASIPISNIISEYSADIIKIKDRTEDEASYNTISVQNIISGKFYIIVSMGSTGFSQLGCTEEYPSVGSIFRARRNGTSNDGSGTVKLLKVQDVDSDSIIYSKFHSNTLGDLYYIKPNSLLTSSDENNSTKVYMLTGGTVSLSTVSASISGFNSLASESSYKRDRVFFLAQASGGGGGGGKEDRSGGGGSAGAFAAGVLKWANTVDLSGIIFSAGSAGNGGNNGGDNGTDGTPSTIHSNGPGGFNFILVIPGGNCGYGATSSYDGAIGDDTSMPYFSAAGKGNSYLATNSNNSTTIFSSNDNAIKIKATSAINGAKAGVLAGSESLNFATFGIPANYGLTELGFTEEYSSHRTIHTPLNFYYNNGASYSLVKSYSGIYPGLAENRSINTASGTPTYPISTVGGNSMYGRGGTTCTVRDSSENNSDGPEALNTIRGTANNSTARTLTNDYINNSFKYNGSGGGGGARRPNIFNDSYPGTKGARGFIRITI